MEVADEAIIERTADGGAVRTCGAGSCRLGAYAAWLFRYSGVSEVEPVADANEPDADYTLDITPYYDVGALYVRQTIEFTNPGEALDRLVLCLPGNAYRRATTGPLDSELV